jgi:hypothetical protein
MHEDVYEDIVSPNGTYKAVFSYRDGLTFGYEHILLEDVRLHGLLAADEITEADESGLGPVKWRGDRTLVVSYSCPDDQLVVREERWRDVRITYEHDPTAPAGRNTPQK